MTWLISSGKDVFSLVARLRNVSSSLEVSNFMRKNELFLQCISSSPLLSSTLRNVKNQKLTNVTHLLLSFYEYHFSSTASLMGTYLLLTDFFRSLIKLTFSRKQLRPWFLRRSSPRSRTCGSTSTPGGAFPSSAIVVNPFSWVGIPSVFITISICRLIAFVASISRGIFRADVTSLSWMAIVL